MLEWHKGKTVYFLSKSNINLLRVYGMCIVHIRYILCVYISFFKLK